MGYLKGGAAKPLIKSKLSRKSLIKLSMIVADVGHIPASAGLEVWELEDGSKRIHNVRSLHKSYLKYGIKNPSELLKLSKELEDNE
jgi:hypothetical protein